MTRERSSVIYAIWGTVFAAVLGAQPVLADVDLTAGLYGHWTFDEELTSTVAENTAWGSPLQGRCDVDGDERSDRYGSHVWKRPVARRRRLCRCGHTGGSKQHRGLHLQCLVQK